MIDLIVAVIVLDNLRFERAKWRSNTLSVQSKFAFASEDYECDSFQKRYHSFFHFFNLFSRIFEVFNEKQIAKRVIQHTVQKNSASNYVIKFQKYINLTKWNDVALMTMFRRELKTALRTRWCETKDSSRI
jgi:hypothetical protein